MQLPDQLDGFTTRQYITLSSLLASKNGTRRWGEAVKRITIKLKALLALMQDPLTDVIHVYLWQESMLRSHWYVDWCVIAIAQYKHQSKAQVECPTESS